VNHCASFPVSGSSQAQEGAVFSNSNCCLIPSPPKNASPAAVKGVAARLWKMRNRRIRHLKMPSQEEDRQWTERCQSRVHQETSAQPLGKELALLNQHNVPTASRSQGQHQPISGPAAVGSTSIRYARCQQHCLQCFWVKQKGFHSRKKQTSVLSLESPASSVKRTPLFVLTFTFDV